MFISACKPTCSSGTSEQGINSKSAPSPHPQFNVNLFSLDKVLQRMPEPNETLQNGNRLPAEIRRNFVREVVNSVRQITHHCPKKGFEVIARMVVKKYPSSFEDCIDKLRIGTGYDSLFKQFVSRNENLNRPYTQQKAVSSGCETKENNGTKSGKRKAEQDSYGCMNWGPSLSPEEEEEEQEQLRKELVKSYEAVEPDFELVMSNMQKTYPLLRKHINSEFRSETTK